MRLLEIALLLFLLANLVWPFLPWERPPWLPASALFLALMQVLSEGYRWQMVPSYALADLLFFIALVAWWRGHPHYRLPPVAAGVGLLLWGVAAALPALIPVPQLPAPTGPFAVGTLTLPLQDPSRPDPYSDPPGQPRRLMLQVWYPAPAGGAGALAPYVNNLEVVAPAVAARFDLPSFVLNHIRLARTHAQSNAPLDPAGAPYPVLLFSHGLGGLRTQNTFLMEELASHGYVVAAVDHTYAAAITVLPPDEAIFFKGGVIDFQDAATTYRTGNALLQQWTGDLGQVLDRLAAWNQADPAGRFDGQLDLERVGVLGHSTGGGATVAFCAGDSRCQAGLVLDGWLTPVDDQVFAGPIHPPLMLMTESGDFFDAQSNNAARTRAAFGLASRGYLLEIAGTYHYDFTDLPLLSPLTDQLGFTGKIGARRALRLIRTYSLAFFDQALKGRPAPLLDGPSPAFPEVSFEKRP